MAFYRQILFVLALTAAIALTAPACIAAGKTDLGLNVDGLNTVSDIVVGHNKKGPYTLEYNNIDPDSVHVVLNGRTLRRGKDYNVDAAKGILAFNSVLVNDAIVRVTYRLTPGKSQKTGGKYNIPVSLDLFQRDDASLKVMGLYAQDDPRNPDAGKSVVGLGGGKKWASGGFDAQFLMSQRTDDDSQQDVGSWERSALKLGANTAIGDLKITGSFLHSGTAFGAGNEFNVGQGKEFADFSAVFAPNSKLQASAKYTESEDTAGKFKGKYEKVNEQNVTYKPTDATTLSVTHSQRENATAAPNSTVSKNANTVALSHKLNDKTSASVTVEDAKITAGGTTDEVKTRQLSVTSSAFRNAVVSLMMTDRDSEQKGEEQGMTLNVSAQANPNLKIDTSFGMLENEAVGDQTTKSLAVTASPFKQVAVTAAVTDTDSSKLGDKTQTKVTVSAKPVDAVELQTTLTGVDQNSDTQFQRQFVLATNPAKFAKIRAELSQKGRSDWDDVTKGASLELLPFSHTQFSAGYRFTENGSNVLTVTDYGAQTKPLDFLSLSGSYRDREQTNDEAYDTAMVQLAFSPKDYFTLTGDYQMNPENKKGAVQLFESTRLGFKTKLGSVAFTTSYAEKDEYQFGRLSDEQMFGMELPAFGSGRLVTGYKLSRYLDGSQLATRTYSLGYNQSVGSDFSLNLTGKYTEQLQDRSVMQDKSEYSAEASLGVRF